MIEKSGPTANKLEITHFPTTTDHWSIRIWESYFSSTIHCNTFIVVVSSVFVKGLRELSHNMWLKHSPHPNVIEHLWEEAENIIIHQYPTL